MSAADHHDHADTIALSDAADSVGATDLFVLRLVDGGQWTNVGGVGRGEGWAGNVAITVQREPLLDEALTTGMARRSVGVPARAFGPYWAEECAVVHLTDEDSIVAFGGTGLSVDDQQVAAAAASAAAAVAGVSVDKQQADEAEVAQAVEAIRSIPAGAPADVAAAIAGRAALALSCEFGAVVMPDGTVVLASDGWRPPADLAVVAASLRPLAGAARLDPVVEQDLSESPLSLTPFTLEDGMVSRCAVSLGSDGAGGVLVVAHAGSAPRGFTRLCRRLARAIGAAAGPVLAQADPDQR